MRLTVAHDAVRRVLSLRMLGRSILFGFSLADSQGGDLGWISVRF